MSAIPPAALRNVSEVDSDFAQNPNSATPIILQITPNRRHASSGFEYPAMLREYGVLEQEWTLFTDNLAFANFLSIKQSRGMNAFLLAIDILALIPPHVASLAGLLTISWYLDAKHANLQGNYFSGIIPLWTAAWNESFFGPKGLSVGFDLPGRRFSPDAAVAPKRGNFYALRMVHGGNEHKQAMAATKAASRARITILKVRDPVLAAGVLPSAQPIAISKSQLRVHNLEKKVLAKWLARQRELQKEVEELRGWKALRKGGST